MDFLPSKRTKVSFCALNIQGFLFFGIEWQIWINIMTDKRSKSFQTVWRRGGFSPEFKRYARYQILLNRHRDGIEGANTTFEQSSVK